MQAQRPTSPIVGLLGNESADVFSGRVRAFLQGLREAGYDVGHNVAIEYRWAEGQNARLKALANDLVSHSVDVIAAISGAPAKAATETIPIVFYIGADPVELGLVSSLSRPGEVSTGFTALSVEVGAKRLELLREVVPTATTVALLLNPTNPGAETLSLAALRAEALVIGIDSFFNAQSGRLGALAVQYVVPTIFQYRDFANSGGLISYGPNFTEPLRQVGISTGRFSRARSRRICLFSKPQR